MTLNVIDGAGIHIESYADTVAALKAAFKAIYGEDLNLDSNSPDGNFLNILALIKQDFLSLVNQDYNSNDPDQAVGASLDRLCAFCGISRKGGTYTKVTVQVTVDRITSLVGLDASSAPYTIADQNGNQFLLITSAASLAVGTHNLNFQAKNLGAVQVQANTITTAVSIIIGVTALNNPAVPYEQGVDQETDAQLRVRRQKSTARPAQGFLESLRAGLLELAGVTSCLVFENNTGEADVNGVPGHSIWVIVDGGADADIAETIYKYRNAGAGMKGTEVVQVVQVDGSTFPVYFDRSLDSDLFIRFQIDVIGSGSYDEDFIKSQLALLYTFGIYDPADVASVAAIIRGINPQLVASSVAVSVDGNTWLTDLVYPISKQDKFVLTADNIEIL